jgi:hypothetical protein
MEGIEFEDEAPLELAGEGDLEEVSRTELTASAKITEVFNAEQKEKDKRKARMKETPKPLRLTKKVKKSRKFHDKDYITIHCNLCEIDYQHAKKDDEGNFMPFALCQHVVFQGANIEE